MSYQRFKCPGAQFALRSLFFIAGTLLVRYAPLFSLLSARILPRSGAVAAAAWWPLSAEQQVWVLAVQFPQPIHVPSSIDVDLLLASTNVFARRLSR